VSETLPQWSGDALDLVVDYVTYVFIPAYAIVASDLMPPALAVPLGGAIVVSSALYFADSRMKTDDYHFRGFPALWNVIAFYLFLLTPQPWVSGVIVVAFVVMTFVPIHVLHPLRVVRWRKITLALTALWGVLSVIAVLRGFDVSAWHAAALVAIGLYVLAADSVFCLFNRGTR
jgi:phosphatidylcholine synthase